MLNPNLVLLVFFSSLVIVDSKSFNVCPDENHKGVSLGTIWIEVAEVKHTSLVRRFRLPPTGLYDEVIGCFMATDLSEDDSGGDAEITDGGYNHRYVEVRLNSKIGKALDYVIMTFAKQKTDNSSISESFNISH